MKTIIVVGGSKGIGNAILNKLLNYSKVINISRTIPEFKHANLTHFSCDITKDNLPDIEAADALIYCPGSINLKPFHRFKEEDFIDDFKLQVTGATKIIKQLLPKLKKAKDSSIVLFSTIAVQSGFSFHSQVSISKGAIEGLTRSLASEFAPHIRVNAIAPSLTNTRLATKFLNTQEKVNLQSEKNPLKRIGQPKDIAQTAAFLLTPQSSWITGQIIHVDGGHSNIK